MAEGAFVPSKESRAFTHGFSFTTIALPLKSKMESSSVVDAARQSVEHFDPLAKTAKKQLSKLRLEHGEELMRFVKEALRDLPEKADGGVAVEASSSVLIEACDAARLILWLGAYPSPVPHKACHNVSVRCKALRRLDLAAEWFHHLA